MAYTPVISSYGLSPMGSARNTLQLTYPARMDEIPVERFGDLPRDDSGWPWLYYTLLTIETSMVTTGLAF